jgi:hypothetical protein
MSEKISEYTTSVTALASGDLMDVSKLISTSPDVYQSQKLNYSVLLTELNADLSITLQSIYNASTQPQILTSVAKGGVVIRSGQALDTNSVLELKNIAGSSTFVVGGNGIVATGNWQATAIAAAFGGTGQTSYAIGDIVYASNTTAISKLGIGTSGQVLTVSGGGIPSWAAVSSSNLGSANLTSTDDARTFTLKSGGTATQNLQFLNSGGGNLLKLSGNSTIDFGSSANYINSNFHCNPATNTNFNVLRGTDVYIQSDVAAYTTYFRGSSWSKIIVLSHDAGQVSVAGSSAGFFALNNTGTESIIQRLDSNGAYILYRNSANANIFAIDANSAAAGIIGDFGVGAFGPYAARLYVKGSGSTSATKTALFQNSASVAALTIKDDGYCILKANNAAIASADLANNEMSFYIDEATNHCVVKVKYSSGTVKTGTFNLT